MSEETTEETVEEVIEETVEEVTENVIEESNNLKQKNKGLPQADDNNVIGSSRTEAKGGKKSGKVYQTNNGAIGSSRADMSPKLKVSEPVKEPETVAIFSTRNVLWQDVGQIKKGFNFVSKETADVWLTRNHVRLATPEEVAEEYGV